MGLNYSGITDIGRKRETNQDSFRTEELGKNLLLMVVCDGMGGAVGGSDASSLAVKTFCEYVKQKIDRESGYSKVMLEAVKKANEAVCEKAEKNQELEGMGTTLVSVLYDGKRYICVWVGDSRIYAITNDGIKQISHDHSFVQTLIDNGSITEEEAKKHPNRNIITRAIGTAADIEADVCVVNSSGFDGVLLCSDGLCGYVDEKKIAAICKAHKSSERCTQCLIDAALENGGPDNVTVIVHQK